MKVEDLNKGITTDHINSKIREITRANVTATANTSYYERSRYVDVSLEYGGR